MRTGFNLDFSPTRAANRTAAEQMIKRGEMEANAIQARDRGLESGISKVGSAILFGIPGLTEGVASGLALEKAKNVATDAMNEVKAGRAIDPEQLMSANNLAEDSQVMTFLKQLFG